MEGRGRGKERMEGKGREGRRGKGPTGNILAMGLTETHNACSNIAPSRGLSTIEYCVLCYRLQQ